MNGLPVVGCYSRHLEESIKGMRARESSLSHPEKCASDVSLTRNHVRSMKQYFKRDFSTKEKKGRVETATVKELLSTEKSGTRGRLVRRRTLYSPISSVTSTLLVTLPPTNIWHEAGLRRRPLVLATDKPTGGSCRLPLRRTFPASGVTWESGLGYRQTG